MQDINTTEIKFTDFQIEMINIALNKAWNELPCNTDDYINTEMLDLSNLFMNLVKQNKYNEKLKLSHQEIDNLEKNPLPCPNEFVDNHDELINEVVNKKINIYYSWRENITEDDEPDLYCYENFESYYEDIDDDDFYDYDDFIHIQAKKKAIKEMNKIAKSEANKKTLSNAKSIHFNNNKGLKVGDILGFKDTVCDNNLRQIVRETKCYFFTRELREIRNHCHADEYIDYEKNKFTSGWNSQEIKVKKNLLNNKNNKIEPFYNNQIKYNYDGKDRYFTIKKVAYNKLKN